MVNLNKKYIFFTTDIRTMGGAQNYVRSKVKYLKKNGWTVYTFFPDNEGEDCVFQEMQEYTGGLIKNLPIYAKDLYGTLSYYELIYEMLQHIQYDPSEKCHYIIESHGENYNVWAEILAKKISAKHIYFCLQENFGLTEKQYMDFLRFKLERKEVAGIADDSLHRMFEGFMNVEISSRFKLFAKSENNIEDIYSKPIAELKKRDFNIGYMGRCEKQYFPFILYELRLFCKKNKDKTIHFIVIGTLKEHAEKLINELKNIDNLTISCLGHFNPLPKMLFEKLDVIIAGAGCALISYRQGIPVIVPNTTTNTAVGILGYTTTSVFSGGDEYSYCDLLEDVLIYKHYLETPYIVINHPSCEEAYEQFFDFVNASKQSTEYYDFAFNIVEEKNHYGVIESVKTFLYHMKENTEMREKFVRWFEKEYGSEVALFGFGKVGKLLRQCVPELVFSHIFDNHEQDLIVERPLAPLLQKLQTIIVTPYGMEDEISRELRYKEYAGVIILLKDVILQYMKYVIEQ